jgi:hypothetical protein
MDDDERFNARRRRSDLLPAVPPNSGNRPPDRPGRGRLTPEEPVSEVHEARIAVLWQAIKENPDDDSSRWRLARILLDDGHIDQGLQLFRELSARQSRRRPIYMLLFCEALAGADRIDEALEVLQNMQPLPDAPSIVKRGRAAIDQALQRRHSLANRPE